MITLAEIRKPLTYAEALDSVLDLMQSLGFETTGWQEGRIEKSLLTTYAMLLSEMSEGVAFTANAGTNDYAAGTQLTVYSAQRFGNERFGAVATEGPVTLTNRSSSAYSGAPGALMFRADNGVEFVSTSPYSIAGGSVSAPHHNDGQRPLHAQGQRRQRRYRHCAHHGDAACGCNLLNFGGSVVHDHRR